MQRDLLRRGLPKHGVAQLLIAESEGTTECIRNQIFRQSAAEYFFVLSDGGSFKNWRTVYANIAFTTRPWTSVSR